MADNKSAAHQGQGLAGKAGEFLIGNDLEVTRLGFGTMRLTGKGIWGEPADRAEAVRVLRRAVELGINFIDTADSYGPSVSEEIIAEALYPYPSNLVIATKGGFERPGPNRWVENGRPEHLRSACEGSLRRLRLEPNRPVSIASNRSESSGRRSAGTLKDLQAEGKIKHIGLSEVSVQQIQHAQTIVPIVSCPESLQLGRPWIGRRSCEYCEKEKMGFIPWFPLAAGKLSGGESPIRRVAEQLNATPSQVALAWLLSRSPVMLPIPGTSNVTHLEENVAAAGLKIDEKEMQELAHAAHA